jgi:hypothetical protein
MPGLAALPAGDAEAVGAAVEEDMGFVVEGRSERLVVQTTGR